MVRYLLVFLLCCVQVQVFAHQVGQAKAHYLANEAVMIEQAGSKILFDPFFHRDFGIYQLVPKHIKQAIMAGEAPYDDIKFIIISHAHDDHFSASDVLNYLVRFKTTQLIAPQQAITQITALSDYQQHKTRLTQRMHAIDLARGDKPWVSSKQGIDFSAVRIPHAGWPQRADVENLVFRVTLPNGATVMHMGDADPDADHYLPYKSHWQAQVTDTAFPPYWFFYSAEGRDILDSIINAKQHIGVHVPIEVPKRLITSGKLFFNTPGETRLIVTER